MDRSFANGNGDSAPDPVIVPQWLKRQPEYAEWRALQASSWTVQA